MDNTKNQLTQTGGKEDWAVQTSKVCTGCRQLQPLSFYNRNKRTRDGRQTRCKECSRKKDKEWYYLRGGKKVKNATNSTTEGKRKRRLEFGRWQARKKGALAEMFSWDEMIGFWIDNGIDPETCYYCKNDPFEHIDHIVPLEKQGAHVLKNIVPACGQCNWSKHTRDVEEFMKEVQLRNNPDNKKECKDCKEKKLLKYFTKEKHSKDGFQSYCSRCYRKRSRKKYEKWWMENDIDPTTCFYCEKEFVNGVYEHLDHFIPKSKGGTNDVSNFRPSCKKCNRDKHTMDPERFLAGLGPLWEV